MEAPVVQGDPLSWIMEHHSLTTTRRLCCHFARNRRRQCTHGLRRWWSVGFAIMFRISAAIVTNSVSNIVGVPSVQVFEGWSLFMISLMSLVTVACFIGPTVGGDGSTTYPLFTHCVCSRLDTLCWALPRKCYFAVLCSVALNGVEGRGELCCSAVCCSAYST